MARRDRITVKEYPICDLCKANEAKYDGKTVYGPWAYMCESCFQTYGVGLGLGRGQRLVLKGGYNEK